MGHADTRSTEREIAGVAAVAAVQTATLADAYARYEAIRPRLPDVRPGGAARVAASLLDTADAFDGYVFDSFGVLNVGETAIAGADDCLRELRSAGKGICILTNAASYTSDAAFEKYRRLGLGVRREEIVSSRDVAVAHLDAVAPGLHWAGISAGADRFEDMDVGVVDLLDGDIGWDAAEGFLLLSSARWTPALQDRLVHALERRSRPVVVANPDLVAPREGGLSVEPGWWAHDLQDRTGVAPHFFGKPFGAAFDAASALLGDGRHAMVGDTLHTDILGGQGAGMGTVLVTRHGLFAGEDVGGYVEDSGIVPDWVVPSI